MNIAERFTRAALMLTALALFAVAGNAAAQVSDLSIIKSDGELDVVAGTLLTYTFNIENTGPDDAAGTTVVDTLPAGFSYVSDTSSFGCTDNTPGAGQVTCLVGIVSEGGTPSFEMVVAVDSNVADGTLAVNTAVVSSDSTDPDPLNNTDSETTLVNAVADLSINKTADPADLVAEGLQLTYSFEVDNSGPSDAQNVQTIDNLPSAFAGQIASMPAQCNEVLGVVTCDWGTLPAGFNTTYDIVIDVPTQGALGSQLNEVEIVSTTTDPNSGNNDSTAAVDVVVAVPADDTALIAVQKFFVDGNDETSVTLTLSCTGGSYAPASVTVNPDDFAPGSAFEQTFVITNIPTGAPNPCTVVEQPVSGYEATYICGQDGSTSDVDTTLCNDFADFTPGTTACGWLDVQAGDSNLCGVFNTPAPVDVEVTKIWEEFGAEQADFDPDVNVTLICEAGAVIVGGTEGSGEVWSKTVAISDFDDEDGEYIGEGTADFEVIPNWYPTASDPDDQEYTECRAVESGIASSAVEVDNDCGDIEVAAGMGDECTITNTVFFEGIPTLSQYGMAIMVLLMLGVGFVGMRRFV